MPVVAGTFEVKMEPRMGKPAEGADVIARFVLDKSYAGGLTAIGRGQMLAARTAIEGSAGYVAMEQVAGTLDGLAGSFVVQHFGIMDRGAPTLQVPIIPDSGTGGLAGISGELAIDVASDGTHSYTLTYELPT